MTALQLSLFASAEPEWENITLEWLFEYLNTHYPELKFKIEKDYDGKDTWIEQSICKKVCLYFYVDRYDKDCVIPGYAGKKFIGGASARLFGAYSGQSIGFNSMEEIENRIRRLTPLECFRLQGFPDEVFKKGSKNISDAQLYKMAGNSVTVNVVEAILKKVVELHETLKEEN